MNTPKFYGILSNDGNGTLEVFIDKETDFDGRLLRHSLTISIDAFTEYLFSALDYLIGDVNAVVDDLKRDNYREEIAEFILLSRAEWVALDEDNNPIEEPVQMFHYVNQ